MNDFIDDHQYDDDVDMDDGAEGVRDVDDGVGGGDDEGEGAADIDDSNGAQGDGDNMGEDDRNRDDDEGHDVIPVVKRTRKTSERITKIKLRKGVYNKDGGGSSSTNPVTLE